jgi:Mg2+ and Co2+ transporter CorA
MVPSVMAEAPVYHNIDDAAAFEQCQASLSSPGACNLLVYFDDERARCATNLSPSNVENVLRNRHQEQVQGQCLWLNLWGWSKEHHEIVRSIAREYDVSTRLAHMISPQPGNGVGTQKATRPIPPSDSSLSDDPEKAQTAAATSSLGSSNTKPAGRRAVSGISDILNDLWHFYSFDIGRRYISLSWNAVFFMPDAEAPDGTHKPNAIRIWSSLLLFDDGTVLSSWESPANLTVDEVKRIRFNQLNIFRHLSKVAPEKAAQNPLMQISIRAAGKRNKSSMTDMASLMLYYLFDDWVNIYEQITGGRDSYRFRLDEIRDQMITSASVDQVKTLHSLGRQLMVLKSIYRSYQAIIDRVILRVQVSAAQDTMDTVRRAEALSRTVTNLSSVEAASTDDPVRNVNLHESQVRLSPKAVARLERLKDRIEICALTEVEECLNEKEAMVLMNFNLIQLKESRAIEKLTRTTILLAKVTILFLPLSLVSAYFSMQFAAIDQMYSLTTYWLTFMVVAILTVVFLIGSNALGFRYAEKGHYRQWMKSIVGDRKMKRI